MALKEWIVTLIWGVVCVGITMLLTAGCWPTTYSFMLERGEVVHCREVLESPCGVFLGKCEDQIDRYCQKNIEEWVGEGDPRFEAELAKFKFKRAI
jgi:hypothetical protein